MKTQIEILEYCLLMFGCERETSSEYRVRPKLSIDKDQI